MTADIVIPAYKPGPKFIRQLEALCTQKVPVSKIIVINTEEAFFPSDLPERIPFPEQTAFEVHHITKADFDHAGARNLGASYSDADVCIFMTDDAVPSDDDLIAELLKPFSDPEVGVVYARQLPDEKAGITERFSRAFNYPVKSVKKTIEDLPRLGIKTFFCSNVCAAYRRDLFDMCGGFEAPAIFNEDMVLACGLIHRKKAVYYAADAKVTHSHSYTNAQQFSRNFDLAVSQAMHPEVFEEIRSESEGVRYVKAAFGYFVKKGRPFAVFPFLVTVVYRYLGFRLGKRYRTLSRKRILKVTMNPGFFRNLWEKNEG